MAKANSRLLLVVVTLWSTIGIAAETNRYPVPDLLIEPAELAKPGAAKPFVILDVRSQESYQQGHVPGAQRVDHDDWKAAFGLGQDREAWSQRIGQLGIGDDSKVVVYDDSAMKNAGRIWWILRYWGVEDLRVLNGGWQGWLSAGGPATDQVSPVSAVPFHVDPRSKRLMTMEQILPQLENGDLQIVDSRSEDEFCGVVLRNNLKGGAIPGAKHLDWVNLIDQETFRFKSPEELRQLFAAAKIDLNRPTVSHCQSGGRASVMAFALELMGARDSRNYYQGWSEWGNSQETPVVVSAGAK